MSRSIFVRLAEKYGPRREILERREFLRRAAIGAAALTAGCAPSAPTRRPLPPEAPVTPDLTIGRVIVIGGGFSGLACAFELLRAGADPIVLEPRGRVGGRVLTLSEPIPGKTIEAGGEFIGANHPTWVGYADRFNLEFRDVSEEDLAYPIVLNGKRLSEDEALDLYEKADLALGALTGMAHAIDPLRPWESPGAFELDNTSVADWLNRQKHPELLRAALATLFAADNGVAIERQSLLCLLATIKGGGLEDYWTQSEVYRCKGGNQRLAESLADAIGRERIKLGVKVVGLRSDGPNLEVITEMNDRLSAEACVLAVPPSAWGAIDMRVPGAETLKPQMGQAIKHISVLKSPHWRSLNLAPDAMTDGDVSLTWHATDNQPGDAGYALTAFSGGPAAERVLARAETPRRQRQRDDLEAIYPGIGGVTEKELFIDWPGDPLTRCGYSFPAPGEIHKFGPTLVNGLGRVQFAGEHCSYGFIGYMEGALASGVRVANRLVGV